MTTRQLAPRTLQPSPWAAKAGSRAGRRGLRSSRQISGQNAMSKLRRLIDDLQETDGLVSRLNAAMSASPDDEILRINTESVQKRRDDLVRRLDQTLHNQQHDFVGYNIMRQVTSYPAERTANDTLLALSNARGGLSVPSVDHAAAAKDFRQAVNASTSQAFVHFPCSEDAFRIFVWDRSNAPRFKPGDSLIIDPQARPAPGDMVFAAAGLSRDPIFGQLSIKRTDTGLVYQVAPLSESWPDHVVSAADIVGVMTEHAAQRR